MQITSRFTIAVHIITCVEYFKDTATVTSNFLAGSVGANPVVIRTVMSKLRKAGIISTSQGKSGISLARPLDEISFYDVYATLDCVDETGLFHFHEHPNEDCPVGRNIHKAMNGKLKEIQNSMENEMRQISLADIADDVRREIRLAG